MKLLIAEDELDLAETLTVNIAHFFCVLLFVVIGEIGVVLLYPQMTCPCIHANRNVKR